MIDDFLEYWLLYGLNGLFYLIDFAAPVSGFVFVVGLLLWWNTKDKDERLLNMWSGVAALGGLLGPASYFGLPFLYEFFVFQQVVMPRWHLFAHIGSAAIGLLTVFFWLRWMQPVLDRIIFRLTAKTGLERTRRTDVRDIKKHLPDTSRPYDPTKYFNLKKGIFLGLNALREPVYQDKGKFEKQHIQIVGKTGSGKSVLSVIMMGQALRAGEAVFVFDPKDDEWAPHVLREEAKKAKVPFYYINLNEDVPQIDLLKSMTSRELDVLFGSVFRLGSQGSDSDHYRRKDRRAARGVAELVGEVRTLAELCCHPVTSAARETAEGFIDSFEELARVTALSGYGGVDFAKVIDEGGCVYIVGHTSYEPIVMAQKLLFVRLIQLVSKRDRINSKPRRVLAMLDEFKYHISRTAMEGLGTARDKGLHVILAHQSLGDLEDCPQDITPAALRSAVIDNCGAKFFYKMEDVDSNQWVSNKSGDIAVDDEVREVSKNLALSEVIEKERRISQGQSKLFEFNHIEQLPEGVGIAFGVTDLPDYVHVCPIKVEKKPLQIARASGPVIQLQHPEVPKPKKKPKPKTEAQPEASEAEVTPPPPPPPVTVTRASIIDVENNNVDF